MAEDPKDAKKKEDQDRSIGGDKERTEKKPNEYGPQGYTPVIGPQGYAPVIVGPSPNVLFSNAIIGPPGPTGPTIYGPLPSIYLDEDTLLQYRSLEREVAELRRKVDEQGQALRAERSGSEDKQKRVQELEQTLAQLSEKLRFNYLLSRVNQDAHRALLNSAEFRGRFATNSECDAFVMSVDIRRSTELMLKARKAEQFASFITTLCNDLIKSVLECNGVFDKFTGDGILAFFPEFFSGPDAGYYTLLAADQCHKAFQSRYHEYRRAFNSILTDTGLGIGVDYGTVQLVEMAGGLSVVGPPVVYACRMGGAPAGKTLLNQPAYEQVCGRVSASCFVQETELEIKHEGNTLAYEVSLSKRPYEPQRPDWCTPQAAIPTAEAAEAASAEENEK